ncbi:hypothetical protein INT45_002683 [Circinella minor]|uniref:F-box domain-containing protein n=1 Tax=Circinella minor TaxID=1195481 RepID=A0A8H7S6C7_9FUNG|nr:hypothetical protein INT45_002683 [Circinella minor]
MNYCENQKNTIDNDSINNNNKSSSSDGTHILTVPRADYLLWCKRRMEGPVINNDTNAMPIIPTINTMLETSTTTTTTTPPSITASLDKKKTTTTTTTVTVPKGSPFGFALPPELLLEILSYLKESQSALYAVSLVCRQWMLCAAPLLYRHAKIMDTFRYATFILTLTRNKKTLFYGSLIHTLDLAAGNKLFGNNNNNKQTNTTHSTTPTGMTDQQMEEERDNAILLPTQEEEDDDDERQDPRREVVTQPESFIDNHGNSDVNNQSTTSTTTTMMTARTTRANWTIQLVNPNNNENNTPVTTTTVTTTNNNNNNDIGWEALLQQRQQQEENNNSSNTTIESEYYEARDMKHGHLFVTTSSLLQVAKTCKNLTCLNMSLTTLFYDSMIAETGEYVSTLQHYAVQPGLTHILIPMSKVIETMGKECIHLQQVIMQRCDWVTAQVIWLWVTHCPKLIRLDARRSNKCSVKKLVSNLLEAEPNPYQQQQLQREEMDHYSQDNHHQQQQDDMGMEMMMNDAPMLDHSEEEEEERIFFGNLRHQPPPQQQQQRRPYFHDRHNHHHPIQNQNNSNNNNNINRIPPVVIHDHELLNIQRYRDNLEALETTLTQRLQQRRGSINQRPSLNRRSTTTRTTRRTSTTNNTSSFSSDNNPIPEWRTLKQVVYDILVDAIERGADLPWFP